MSTQRSTRRRNQKQTSFKLEIKGSGVRNRTPPRRGRWRKSESVLESIDTVRASNVFSPGSISRRRDSTEFEESKYADSPIDVFDPPPKQLPYEDVDMDEEDTKISAPSRIFSRPREALSKISASRPDSPLKCHKSPNELEPDQDVRASVACPSFPSYRDTMMRRTPTRRCSSSPTPCFDRLEDPIKSLSPNKIVRGSTVLSVGVPGLKTQNKNTFNQNVDHASSPVLLITPRSPLFECAVTRSSIAPSPGLPQSRKLARRMSKFEAPCKSLSPTIAMKNKPKRKDLRFKLLMQRQCLEKKRIEKQKSQRKKSYDIKQRAFKEMMKQQQSNNAFPSFDHDERAALKSLDASSYLIYDDDSAHQTSSCSDISPPLSKSREMDAAFEFLLMSQSGGETPSSSPISSHRTHLQSPIKMVGGGISNRKLVRNALLYTCLAGTHLKSKLESALSALSSSSANRFLVLFGQKRLNFRGLYEVKFFSATKIFGVGPNILSSEMISAFYKYSSGSKCFKILSVQEFANNITDGVNLKPEFWRR